MRPTKTATTLVTLLVASLAVGCGGHSRSSSSGATAAGSTAGGSTANPGGTGGTGTSAAEIQVTVDTAPSTSRFAPDAIVALAFSLEATGANQQVTRLDLTSTGSIDESILGGIEVIEDTNGNGLVDAGEPVVANAPNAQNDNDDYVVQPVSALALTTGTPRSFLVTVDGTQVAAADQAANVGNTIALELDVANVVSEDDAGQPTTSTGSGITNTVTLEVNDTVLISEVVPGPGSTSTSAEYVELFNATAQPVDLSDYYLTDMTQDPTNGKFYWKLPTGDNFTGYTSDFIVRFPQGATIQPGQVITVAIDGGGFSAFHGSNPDYVLRNPAATGATQMLTWDGVVGGVNFVSAPVSSSAGLTGYSLSNNFSTGELVCLFTWDGTSDLVQDVDLINYGDASASNTSVDKSPNQQATNPGAPDVKVDSAFDSDTTESTFQDDSDDLFQYNHRAPNGPSLRRVDFTEGNEIKTGGNGITGNNETSENFGDGIGGNGTFQLEQTPTPGQL